MRGTRTALRSGVAALVALTVCLALAAPSAADERTPRIVGGQETTIEEWPWQVAIADPPSTGGDGYDRQFCGGSLVAPTVVVTAAHCITSGENFQAPGDFSVISGRTTLSSNAGQETPVVEVYYPVDTGTGVAIEAQTPAGSGDELYDDFTLEWDWGILRLATAAGAPAQPIQIASAAEASFWEPGDPAFVTGWGNTQSPAGFPDDLHEAEIEIIADDDCDNNNVYGSDFFADTMVCAGFLDGDVDTCQGDSGGPLVVPIDNPPTTFRLVGDTSWGEGCAEMNAPGVYGRLADEPMRSAVIAAIAAAQEPLPDPPPEPPVTEPPVTEPPPATDTGDNACAEARDKLRTAKRKLRRAKRKLEKADTKVEERRAERRVKKAKRRVRRAKAQVAAAC